MSPCDFQLRKGFRQLAATGQLGFCFNSSNLKDSRFRQKTYWNAYVALRRATSNCTVLGRKAQWLAFMTSHNIRKKLWLLLHCYFVACSVLEAFSYKARTGEMRQNSITRSKETTKLFKYTVTIETYKNQVSPKFVWVINYAGNGVGRTRGFSSIIVERIVIKKPSLKLAIHFPRPARLN